VVARDLVDSAHILTLPGTMFGPRREEGGDGQAEATLRIAFANPMSPGLGEVCDRLAAIPC
jgi:aspartate/methionine/tyrosine aminotransferase